LKLGRRKAGTRHRLLPLRRCQQNWTAAQPKLSVQHHRPYRLAALHQLEALVDAFQRQPVRDQLVDPQLAVLLRVDGRFVPKRRAMASRPGLSDAAAQAVASGPSEFILNLAFS
jgi:hypothetical protein